MAVWRARCDRSSVTCSRTAIAAPPASPNHRIQDVLGALDLVLGIRDVSDELQFKSSYTVVEHAPEEPIALEIERHALEQIEKLQAAARDGDFTELFRLLGTSEAQRAIEDGVRRY